MLLVMYSRKETVLNIHIKTRNTLKKVLHWTVFFLFVCFVLIFFVHISYKTFTSTYLHSAKNTRCQWTYFKHFLMEVRATKSVHTAYLLSNQKYFREHDFQYTVVSHHTASHCIQPDILHLLYTHCQHHRRLAEFSAWFALKYRYQIGFQLFKC